MTALVVLAYAAALILPLAAICAYLPAEDRVRDWRRARRQAVPETAAHAAGAMWMRERAIRRGVRPVTP
jgi:hypothetical protein